MPESTVKIPVDLSIGGGIQLFIADSANSPGLKRVSIVYTPDTKPEKPMMFGSRDVTGMGRLLLMVENSDGKWQVDIEMHTNESREFDLLIGMPEGPPDYSSPSAFQSKIGLWNGELIADLYERQEKPKGQLQKRVYKQDGTLSEPLLSSDVQLKPGEEIVDVYMPPGYNPAQSYNVQIMLDGDSHIGSDVYGNHTEAPFIFDNLINTRKMEPVIVVFTSPTPPIGPPGPDQKTPRLNEYGCNLTTDARLCKLPAALKQSGLNVNTSNANICGQSMGGLQAIYTGKMHPDIFSTVIAQSPALWWEPPEVRKGHYAIYNQDQTWRAPLKPPFPLKFPLSDKDRQDAENSSYQGHIHTMLSSGFDSISGKLVPIGEVQILLQAGTYEAGTHDPNSQEPLIQATRTLATQINSPLLVYDGCHCAPPWATGLSQMLPTAHPKTQLTAEEQTSPRSYLTAYKQAPQTNVDNKTEAAAVPPEDKASKKPSIK